MSLTNEQLQELTALVHARIDEFSRESVHLTKPTLGVMRIAHDVIKKWYEEKEESWARRRISDVTITSEMAMKLSTQGYETGYQAAKRELAPTGSPLGPESDKAITDQLANEGYAQGYQHGYAEAKRVFAYQQGDYDHACPALAKPEGDEEAKLHGTQTPQGHTIHVNGDPNMSEETAQALREVADKVFEQMSKKAEAESAPPKDDEKLTGEPEPVDNPPPPTVALIYKREPAEAEIAYGQKLARELDSIRSAADAGTMSGEQAEYEEREIFAEMQELERDTWATATRDMPTDNFPALSPAAAATLGPEHVVVTPLVPRRTVAPLTDDAPQFDYTPHPPSRPLVPRRQLPDPDVARENVAAALAHGEENLVAAVQGRRPGRPAGHYGPNAAKGRRGNVLPTREEIIAELQRQSMGTGDMPSMATFDAARPGNWSAATSHLARLGLTWTDLAMQAGLKPDSRGNERKRKVT